jgi:hypothetical protein
VAAHMATHAGVRVRPPCARPLSCLSLLLVLFHHQYL